LTFQKSFSRTQQDKTAQKKYLTRGKNKAPKRQPKGFGFFFSLPISFFFFSKGRDQKMFFLEEFLFLPPSALFVFFGPFAVSSPTKLPFI